MSLPVFEIAAPLRDALSGGPRARVLLKAPTGSGKSTVVPGWVADELPPGKMTVVIEPRRMAARLLAGWVARQRGVELGREVGYAVRFDSRYRADTRIVFVTDGVFQRWLHDDPRLEGVGAVVFDEFHERRLAVDIALARCLDLQDGPRPDLRLVVMSATLETGPLAEFIAPAVALEAGGRTFPVEIHHRAERVASHDRRGGPQRETPLWDRMAAVAREAAGLPDSGNLLLFLPGTHEIRRTIERLRQEAWTRPYDVLPLYSSLPPAEQEAAVAAGGRPKIIVATNVAETSLTIDGVRTVVDSGLARVAAFDPRRGIDTLLIAKISRAAAEQRAGRAGRTAAGRCFRLWSAADHARRDEFELPEVRRVDLAEAALLLKTAGVGELADFRWLDAPEPGALGRALDLLQALGALDAEGRVTAEGRAMAALPLAPRFSRLVLAGREFGCPAEAVFIAAAAQGEAVFAGKRAAAARREFAQEGDGCDFAAEWRALALARDLGFDARRCEPSGIHARAARELARTEERLRQLASRGAGGRLGEVDFEARGESVGRAVLAAFSDQLAIRLSASTLACRMVGQRRGRLEDESCARNAGLFVAAEITEVEAREVIVHLRRATVVDPAWLAEQFPQDVREADGAAYDETRRRVVRRREFRFRDLVIESRESDHGVNPDQAAEILAARVISGELLLKNWNAKVGQWTTRLECLGRWMPGLELPGWGEEDRAAAIAQICHGAFSYKEIKDADVWSVLREWLSHAQAAALDQYCPERVTLANGQSAKITYEPGRDPWIAIRVSHLFGVWRTPRIADGRVPLLVHILTPGQRPWQVTKDLEGFWESGYFQMKKELGGRYPKHPWPDDPRAWHAAGGGRRK